VTRKEWTDRAEEYYAKARAAYDVDDVALGEMYERKGDACMSNADYGTEVEWPQKAEA
jgi:hypothetical protein